MENLVLVPIFYIVATKMVDSVHIRCTQLLFATGIEGGIHDCQVQKYQPYVTSRLIFQYLMIINGME